jgi:hypothetical protein
VELAQKHGTRAVVAPGSRNLPTGMKRAVWRQRIEFSFGPATGAFSVAIAGIIGCHARRPSSSPRRFKFGAGAMVPESRLAARQNVEFGDDD